MIISVEARDGYTLCSGLQNKVLTNSGSLTVYADNYLSKEIACSLEDIVEVFGAIVVHARSLNSLSQNQTCTVCQSISEFTDYVINSIKSISQDLQAKADLSNKILIAMAARETDILVMMQAGQRESIRLQAQLTELLTKKDVLENTIKDLDNQLGSIQNEIEQSNSRMNTMVGLGAVSSVFFFPPITFFCLATAAGESHNQKVKSEMKADLVFTQTQLKYDVETVSASCNHQKFLIRQIQQEIANMQAMKDSEARKMSQFSKQSTNIKNVYLNLEEIKANCKIFSYRIKDCIEFEFDEKQISSFVYQMTSIRDSLLELLLTT